jgi:hypothetical protein
MRSCLKSLLLLAVLPLSVASISQEAVAEDRFDVTVELLHFYSRTAADRPLDQPNVNYQYTVNVDIPDIGQQSVEKAVVKGSPKRNLHLNRTIHFHNVRKPDRSDSLIKFSAYATGRYMGRLDGHHKVVGMGTTRSATTTDLFREADHSRDDIAVQTVVVQNQRYHIVLRVTVVEID